MAEICIASIARVLKFNGELVINISSRTVVISVLVSLPILSVINLHAKSLWSVAIGICSYYRGVRGDTGTAIGERMKKEDGVDLQCVICLCDVSEGEVYRLLPKCKHGFHVSCIDVWLQTHSTCPLCRCPVPCTSVKNAKNDADQYLIDAILSHFHSFLDHVCTWFVNPLGFELTSTLSEDYRSVL